MAVNSVFAWLAALAVICAYLLLDNYLAGRKRAAALRTRIAPDGSVVDAGTFANSSIGLNGDPSPLAATLLALLRVLGVNVEEGTSRIARRLAQAGILSADAPACYLFFQRIGGVALLSLALVLLLTASGDTRLMAYSFALFLALAAIFAPRLYLRNAIDKRKQKLQRAFPDTLDLLLICVESGLALDASLTRVCSELGRAYPEMTAELNRTRMELALLNDRVRALSNLGERTDMTAFRALVSSLIQSERFGTSLTDTLRVLSDEFRVQRLVDAEVRAARLPVFITLPLIFLLMPAFFLIVLGPAIVRIHNNGQQLTGR